MDDREAVLRRRAALVGSALAVLGCSAAKSVPATATATVVELPSEDAFASSGDDDLPERTPQRKSATLGVMPSVDIPAGLSEDVRRRFEYLIAQITRAHELLDDIEHDLPRCRLSDAACESGWREIAKKTVEIESAIRWLRPECPGSSAGAKLYMQRAVAHLDYFAARRQEVFRPFEQELEKGGEAALRQWEKLTSEARAARPTVCLSIVCQDW